MNNHQSISHFQRLRADASGCQGDESRQRHNDEETAPASVFHSHADEDLEPLQIINFSNNDQWSDKQFVSVQSVSVVRPC